MKRILCMILALFLSLGGAAAEEFLVQEEGSAPPVDAALQGEYQAAEAMLEKGDLIAAANAFSRLGKQGNAALYTQYLQAYLYFLRNTPGKAIAGFAALGAFLDSATLGAQASALYCHRFAQNGLFGYVDSQGKELVAPQFSWAERGFRRESIAPDSGENPQPVAVVFNGRTVSDGRDLLPVAGKYGLLRRDGSLAAPLQYDEVLWTVEGLAALRQGDQYVLLDLQTGQPIGQRYEGIGALSEGLIPVKAYGKWGYLSRQGKLLPGDFSWDSALPFQEGKAGVSLDQLAGFIDAGGQVVIPLQYDAVSSFGNGLAGFLQKKKWGFIDPKGEVVVKPAFQAVGVFHQDRCRASRSKKWGVIDKAGDWVVPYKYDEITDYDPIYHRAWMRNNKLWGLLSLGGDVVLAPTWATFTPLAPDGMSAVSYKGSYGYIDPQGVNRIPNGYGAAAAFSAGVGGVRDEGGPVTYLDKLSRGFTVVSDVPTQPMNGFIEGRIVTTTPMVKRDAKTGKAKQSVQYHISFLLYDLEGRPIDIR